MKRPPKSWIVPSAIGLALATAYGTASAQTTDTTATRTDTTATRTNAAQTNAAQTNAAQTNAAQTNAAQTNATRTDAGAMRTGGAAVRTGSGPVVGSIDARARTFRGIPYAAPPVGRLRWRSPQPVRSWTKPRQATEYGDICPQPDYNKPSRPAKASEDCLTLNVTTPRAASPEHLKPVVVYVYGGDFSTGSANQYDPRPLAVKGDVVAVTFNYRTGIYGFFGYPGLPGSGDFGLQDQQAALRWVHRNARAFGGDPGNVTLMGESAGAVSTCGQLTSPAAKGLFQKAIMESASCGSLNPTLLPSPVPTPMPEHPTAASPWQPVSAITAQGAEAGAALKKTGIAQHKCDETTPVLDCLRRLAPATLNGPSGFGGFASPAYGGHGLIPVKPEKALRTGAFTHVPVIIGHNRDEARFVTSSLVNPQINPGGIAYAPTDASKYQALIGAIFPGRKDEVLRTYPVGSGEYGAAQAYANVEGDRTSVCPVLTDADALARKVPVYAYEFADPDAPTWTPLPAGFPGGATHLSELFYLFTPDRPALGPNPQPPVQFTPAQRKLSDKMIADWSTFAHHATPWPRYQNHRVRTLQPTRTGTIDDAAQHHCKLWK